MDRRELAKKSGVGLCGFLLGTAPATRSGTTLVGKAVDWDKLECICCMPLPVDGYGDTVWLNIYRSPNSSDITEYYSHISLGGPSGKGSLCADVNYIEPTT